MTEPSRDEPTISSASPKWSGDERALKRRLHDMSLACCDEAAAAINSLSEEVERLRVAHSLELDRGNAWRNRAEAAERHLAEVRDKEREACARIADGFTCGGCGMDGKCASAIRARSDEGRAQDVKEG